MTVDQLGDRLVDLASHSEVEEEEMESELEVQQTLWEATQSSEVVAMHSARQEVAMAQEVMAHLEEMALDREDKLQVLQAVQLSEMEEVR